MSEALRRNEKGEILDQYKNPLEERAESHTSDRRLTHDMARNALASVTRLRERDAGPEELAEALERKAKSETLEAAANWKGYEHFLNNKDAYMQAAREEGQSRYKAERDEEGRIVDTENQPLEEVAERNMREIKDRDEFAQANIGNESITSDGQPLDWESANERDEARDQHREHYLKNQGAYYEAAQDEDRQREANKQ